MLDYSMLYPVATVSRRVVSTDGMRKFISDEKSKGKKMVVRIVESEISEGISGYKSCGISSEGSLDKPSVDYKD